MPRATKNPPLNPGDRVRGKQGKRHETGTVIGEWVLKLCSEEINMVRVQWDDSPYGPRSFDVSRSYLHLIGQKA